MNKVAVERTSELVEIENKSYTKRNSLLKTFNGFTNKEDNSERLTAWHTLLAEEEDQDEINNAVESFSASVTDIIKEIANEQVKISVKQITRNIVDTIHESGSKSEFLIKEAISDGMPNLSEAFVMHLLLNELNLLLTMIIESERDAVLDNIRQIKGILKALNPDDEVKSYNVASKKLNGISKCSYNYWSLYLNKRWKRSNVRKYYHGIGLQPKEADEAIATFALVDALLLTIPYGVISSYGTDYWDMVKDAYADCGDTDHALYNQARGYVMFDLNCSVYSTVLAMALCSFYYILRPQDDNTFTKWWFRGKYVLTVCFGLTVCGVTSTLRVYMDLTSSYVVASDEWCNQSPIDNSNPTNDSSFIGGAVIVFAIVSSILLML